MIRRLIFAAFIALVSGAWFGGHGSGGSRTPSDALSALIANTIATCGHQCWLQLNATTGHGLPYQVLRDYGITTANLNSTSNDPFADGSNLLGFTCLDPQNDANIFSYSAPGIRYPDGKLEFVATGGHCASGISAAFTFDVMAAATSLNGGGAGGVWQMPVAPARLLQCSDGAPAWQPQSGCGLTGSWWYNTNPSGQQMPIDCHAYWSNQWIPNKHKAIWSGIFCTDQGGSPIPMGAGYYDDDTPTGTDSGTVHFPTAVNINTFYGYFSQPAHTRLGPGAMNDLTGCYYTYNEGSFIRVCSLDSTPVWVGVGGTGLDVAPSATPANMFPDPANPTTRRWFTAWGKSSSCWSPTFSPCFALWTDTGATPDTAYTYARLALTTPIPAEFNGSYNGAVGTCYDAALNTILMTHGGQHLWKIGDLNNGGAITTNLTNWGFVEYTTTIRGVTPGVTNDSGTPATCLSLEPAYHAIILALADQTTKKYGVWLFVK